MHAGWMTPWHRRMRRFIGPRMPAATGYSQAIPRPHHSAKPLEAKALSAHEFGVERVFCQVIELIVGNKHLIFQLDRKIAPLFAEQGLDTKCHARLKLIVECPFDHVGWI